jgi:hypothetical protein
LPNIDAVEMGSEGEQLRIDARCRCRLRERKGGASMWYDPHGRRAPRGKRQIADVIQLRNGLAEGDRSQGHHQQ